MNLEPLVLYEDENILVLDKPAGLVVTPGAGYEEEDTLVGWLIERVGESLREVGAEAHRPGIVHRLDKDTSGVMVTAKTQMAFEALVEQFKNREVEKEYRVLVWGDVYDNPKMRQYDPGEGAEFSIDAPIGRNPKNRMRFAVVHDGKSALTKFQIVRTRELGENLVTELRCFPQSGRTHQIRVHLKSFGHSVVGDPLYQGRNASNRYEHAVRDDLLAPRMYLHATALGITVPGTDEVRTFEMEVPDVFLID